MSRTARVALATAAALTAAVALAALLVPSDWGREAVRHARPLTVFLHRAGAARWPQNSLVAVEGAVAAGVDGLEVDIGLTRDGVPVLAHDPWVDPVRCTHADGRPITEQVLIAQQTFAALSAGFRCGGLPDPDFPAVQPVATPIASLEAALAVLGRDPGVALYLDLKIEPPLTATAADFASAVFARWRAAGIDNPLYIEGPDEVAIAALRAAAGEARFTALMSAPPFQSGENWTLKGVLARVAGRLAPRAWVEQVAAARADGLVTHTAVLHWPTGLAARDAGQQVVIFGAADAAEVQRFCQWPITALIVADPALATCAAGQAVARGE